MTNTPSTRLQMPFLLLCGTGLTAFYAVLGSVVVAGMALIAGLGNGPFTVDGHPATKAQFWAFVWPLLLTFAILAAGAWAFTFAIWQERPWSRPLAVGLWVFPVLLAAGEPLYSPDSKDQWPMNLVATLLCAGVAIWYFYGQRSVVEYYDHLARRTRAA